MSQSKSILFAVIIFFVFSIISTSIVFADVYPPRKQMANGISAEDVVCEKELQLMIKNNDNAICVKLSSTTRLVDSGIAKIIDTSMREPITDEEKKKILVEDVEVKETTVNEIDDIDLTPEKILIRPELSSYKPGSDIIFTGSATPNQDLKVSLEDPNENEVFSDILEIDSSGDVFFKVISDVSFIEGTYFLISTQLDDSEITPVRIGKNSDDIAVVIEKFNHERNSQATLEIFGPSSSEIDLTIFDPHRLEQLEDTIQLDPEGYAEYMVDLSDYKVGIYSMLLSHGSEEIDEEFAIGLKNTSTPIEIMLLKDSYHLGDTAILFGKSSRSSLILIEMIDPNGEIINKIEHYTQRDGKFTYPFEIPHGNQFGTWNMRVSSGSDNISEINFDVRDAAVDFTIELDKDEPYKQGDFVIISGYGMDEISQISIQIKDTTIIDELKINPKSDYTFSTTWEIPYELNPGVYKIIVESGTSQDTIDLTVEPGTSQETIDPTTE